MTARFAWTCLKSSRILKRFLPRVGSAAYRGSSGGEQSAQQPILASCGDLGPT
jgi:hypothetical protein